MSSQAILASNGYSQQQIAEVMQLPEKMRREILDAHRSFGDRRGKCGLEVKGTQPMPGSHRYPWKQR